MALLSFKEKYFNQEEIDCSEETQVQTAFVLINAEAGSETEVLRELSKVEGVKEVLQVFGVYDIIARIEAQDMHELKETILHCIRKRGGIKSTLTMVVSES